MEGCLESGEMNRENIWGTARKRKVINKMEVIGQNALELEVGRYVNRRESTVKKCGS